MEAKAYLKYARISPRKVSIVLDLIRGKDVATAMAILKNTNKIACESLEKLLASAVANAENNFGMDVDKLQAGMKTLVSQMDKDPRLLVAENDIFIFVNDLRRDLLTGDLTKDTILQLLHLPPLCY